MTFPSTRHRHDEWMDRADIDPQLHAQALIGLRRIHRFSGTLATLWQPIERLAKARANRDGPLRVLDLASGGGDLAIGLLKHARRHRVDLSLTGCDLSTTAVAYAQRQAEDAGVSAEFIQLDVLHDRLPTGFDVICNSLFLHHLETRDVVKLLQQIRQAAPRLVVISDLRRSRIGYWMAWWGCRLLTRSPVCRVDGPLSVEAGWTAPEMQQLWRDAGLDEVHIEPRWPSRFVMTWEGPQ